MNAAVVSDREREMAEACVLFAALMTRANAEIIALTAENKTLRGERDQALLAAKSNHDVIVERVADEDPTRWCIPCGAQTRAQCSCGPIASNE